MQANNARLKEGATAKRRRLTPVIVKPAIAIGLYPNLSTIGPTNNWTIHIVRKATITSVPSCASFMPRAAISSLEMEPRIIKQMATVKVDNNATNAVDFSLFFFLMKLIEEFYYFSNDASKAISEGGKSILLTNAHASVAPCSRSMPLSSHSTDNGPL